MKEVKTLKNNFYAMLSRMKYINRWALMRNTVNENLCEHTLEVTYITHCLCVIATTRLGKKVDISYAVLRAMYHDTPEIITGDLPTPVKYYNETISKAYKEVETAAIDKLSSMMPDDFRDSYLPLLQECDSYEAKLVKAADKISALVKCTEELNAGNREFSEALHSTKKSIENSGIEEAEIFLKEFMPAYDLTLDEQSK